MKKSIKYAGIAAATLLTVAPIAAPVVSQAATSSQVSTDKAGNVDQKSIDDALSDFEDQFDHRDATDVNGLDAVKNATNKTLAMGENNKVKLSSLATDAPALVALMKSADTDNASFAVLSRAETAASAAKDATVYMTAKGANNVTYDGSSVTQNADQFAKAITSDDNLPMTVTVNLRYVDAQGQYANKTVDFNLNKSNDNELKSVNAKFDNPINVAKKTDIVNTQLTNAANLSVVDQDGNSILTKSNSLSGLYFHTYAQVINYINSGLEDKTGLINNDTDYVKDGQFNKAGTYYQAVQFYAEKGSSLASFMTEYQKNPSDYTVYVNGKKASAGYDFTTSYKDMVLTFVRTINVSDSEAKWTVEDVDGQVTTKNDASYYTLKNNDNATITNRALMANTDWVTDKVRTDQDGNKQYRVATGEWVNANDVTFTKAGETPAGDGLTDIQKVTGTASLDGGNYVYFLYGKDGKVLTQRSLMPGTDWHVINTAKDSQGNTYYRVATNEWLQQGTGVHFN